MRAKSQISNLKFEIALIALCFAINAQALDPQSVTITNLRDEAESYISSTEFYRGQILRFTNCVIYSGSSTSSAPQNLTNITISVIHGTEASNITTTATSQVNTSGTWTCDFTLSTNFNVPFLWIKLTDSATNVLIYPAKKIHTRASP